MYRNWRLMLTIAVTTAGASFQFYSFGAINTPQRIVESWMNETLSRRYSTQISPSTLTLIWSLTVGSACVGAILGSMVTSLLAERFGRKRSLILNGAMTLIGGALEGFSKMAASPEMLIAGRLFLGFSNGVATGMVPLFLTEIAPVERRGAAGTAHQIVVAFADWFSLLITLPRVLGSERLWPVAFAFPAIPAALMVLILPWTEESPRYLLMTRRDREAAKKAVRFYAADDQEYDRTLDGLVVEAAAQFSSSGGDEKHWSDFFRKRELRLPLTITILIMTAQQFTGCAVMFGFSTNIFVQASLPYDVAELSTLAIGICYFVFTLPSPYFIEKFGRRKLSLFQLSSCLFFLILLTVFIALRNRYQLEWASYGSIGVLVAYMCVYGVGSSVPWIITTELYEQEYRSFGVSVGTFAAWFWAFVITTGYYPFQQAVGVEYSFLPFIVVLAISILGMWALLPETKNKTIAEIVKEFRKRKTSISLSLNHSTKGGKLSDNRYPELAALLEETGEDGAAGDDEDQERHRLLGSNSNYQSISRSG